MPGGAFTEIDPEEAKRRDIAVAGIERVQFESPAPAPPGRVTRATGGPGTGARHRSPPEAVTDGLGRDKPGMGA